MDFNDRRPTCATCQSPGNEYGGTTNHGCPSCGTTISPVVTVKGGKVHHDGQPLATSWVRPEDGGVTASHYQAGYEGHGSDRVVHGRGKSDLAAAEDAARRDAASRGKTFVKRPAAVRRTIKEARGE